MSLKDLYEKVLEIFIQNDECDDPDSLEWVLGNNSFRLLRLMKSGQFDEDDLEEFIKRFNEELQEIGEAQEVSLAVKLTLYARQSHAVFDGECSDEDIKFKGSLSAQKDVPRSMDFYEPPPSRPDSGFAGSGSDSDPSSSPPSPVLMSQHKKARYPDYDENARLRKEEVEIDGEEVTVLCMSNPGEYIGRHPSLLDNVLEDYDVLISLSPVEMGFCQNKIKQAVDEGGIVYYSGKASDLAKGSDPGPESMYIKDFHAMSHSQFEFLQKILSEAAEKKQSIALHCGSGCGRTGHVLCAMKLIERITKMSLADLESYNYSNTHVRVELSDGKATGCKGESFGTPLIAEIEKEVSGNMKRDHDNPIENDEQLERLMEFEKVLVEQCLAKAQNRPSKK